jgi:hypothetical protein
MFILYLSHMHEQQEIDVESFLIQFDMFLRFPLSLARARHEM